VAERERESNLTKPATCCATNVAADVTSKRAKKIKNKKEKPDRAELEWRVRGLLYF
jgi:acyl-CoA hydrolase